MRPAPSNDGLRAPRLTKQALYWRLKAGWPLDVAIVTPVRRWVRKARAVTR